MNGLCECGCGKVTRKVGHTVTALGIKRGDQRRFVNGYNKPVLTHGMSGTRIFYVWNEMLERCRNPKKKAFPNYGGRGIKVCERWQKFENFFADMGQPELGLTLERANNDGDYEPSNCHWATRRAQMNNMRRNVFVSHNGEVKTLTEWSRELKIPYQTLKWRRARGWDVPDLLRTRA